MTTATCLGARKANMKAYVVVIASTNTRQSKMGCMLRGGSETASCLLYWKKMIGAATSLSPVEKKYRFFLVPFYDRFKKIVN